MEEEKKMFEEIEPLIMDYIAYTKQETPDVWFDSRAAAQLEREKKQYSNDIEGELLRQLDEEKGKEKREKLIEQLNQIREENKQQKREVIYGKAKEFIDSNKEKMNKEIEEKTAELEAVKKERNQAIISKNKAYSLRKTVFKQVGENSKVYKAADEEAKEALENMKSLGKKYDEINKQLEESQGKLASFEEKYNGIEFSSSAGVYNLLDIIGIQEEQLEARMSDGQVYQSGRKVDDMGEIKRMQEEATRQQLREELETRFREMETGYEDLLLDKYVYARENALGTQDIDDLQSILDDLTGKSLLDVYKEQVKFFKDDEETRKKLEDLIKKVEDRKAELENFKSGAKAPEAKTPGAKTPGAKAPEAKAPEAKEPGAKAPEAKAPEAKTPGAKAPEAKTPGAKAPEAKAPETKTPEEKVTIKNITIGQEISIEYNKDNNKKEILDFKRIKANLEKTNEEKIDMMKKLGINSISIEEKQLSRIDSNVIYALLRATKSGVSKEEAREALEGYMGALKGEKESQENTKKWLNYDMRDMKFLKPRNLWKRLTRGQEYDQLYNYAIAADNKGMANVEHDSWGPIRRMFSKVFLTEPLRIDGKVYEAKTKGQMRMSIKKKANRMLNQSEVEKAYKSYKKASKLKDREDIKIDDDVKKKIEKVTEKFNEDMKNPTYNMDINSKLNKGIEK